MLAAVGRRLDGRWRGNDEIEARVTDADERALLRAQVEDLRGEGDDLEALLAMLSSADWERPTAFKQWTAWDVVAHLHLSDHMGLASLAGEDHFRELMRDMAASRLPMTGYARRRFGDLAGTDLRARWRATLHDLCTGLADADPDVRLAWAGPGMKPRMFATARQMETWAHGSEIYDLLGVERVEKDRLRNIATIGVRTYAWTFANRGLAPPGPPPHVRLTAPSGVLWQWNAPSAGNRVAGSALEFCQVVTQTRNVADTRLSVVGEPALRWMTIAQCFAGPPENPPAPGTRVTAAQRPGARR
jgi:uncharacterized protein (TIGR03084 family)